MLDTVQGFLALNLDVAATRRIAGWLRVIRGHAGPQADGAAWTPATRLHVALRTLGEMDRAAAPALADQLRSVAEVLSAARIQFGPCEGYPTAEAARLLIVRVIDQAGALLQATEAIERVVQSFGFQASRAASEPLLVLARTPSPVNVTEWLAAPGQPSPGEARITELALYGKEVLHPGAEFAALARLAVSAPSARSQRPSRAPKPSQRPRSRSKPPAGDGAPVPTAIPKPPRLPSVPVPAPAPAEETVAPAQGEVLPPPAPRKVPSLPPSIEAELPNEDDWK